MNRLEFRAWDIANMCFAQYTDDILISCSGKVFELDYDESEDGTLVECHGGYIIEQYTGLRDKNGKKIFEGDGDKDYGCVFFDDGMYMVFIDGIGRVPLSDIEDFEICSNIHENPELRGMR
jgi:hypothetical protein